MSLSELGAYLQRQREESGLSYADIEAQTRIRAKYLRAIEFGEWDDLPPGVYTRGLVKMYARSLGLSASTVLRMYAKERPNEARLPEPQLMNRPLIRQPRLSFETVLSGVVFLVAAGLFGWMVVTQLGPVVRRLAADGDVAPSAAPTSTGAAPAAATPIATRQLGGTTTSATRAAGAAAPTSATASATGGTAVAALGGTTVPQPTVAAQTTTTATLGLVIQIEAVEDAWLSVYLDDAAKPAFYTFLKPGATPLRFEARSLVRLRTGNAGGTRVSLNGRDAGSLGDKGDVKELQWRLAADGTIVQQEL